MTNTPPFTPDDPALHRALRALPTPTAPATLAPRVMAAVAARLARRSVVTWFDWPMWARTLSAAAALLVVAFMVWEAPVVLAAVGEMVDSVAAAVTSRLAPVVALTDVAAPLLNAWQGVALRAVAVLTAFILFAATCGALLDRLALGGASR